MGDIEGWDPKDMEQEVNYETPEMPAARPQCGNPNGSSYKDRVSCAFYNHDAAPFTFFGSAEKIARDKALVSDFRSRHGMSSDPHGPIVGTAEEVERKTALLRDFKNKL